MLGFDPKTTLAARRVRNDQSADRIDHSPLLLCDYSHRLGKPIYDYHETGPPRNVYSFFGLVCELMLNPGKVYAINNSSSKSNILACHAGLDNELLFQTFITTEIIVRLSLSLCLQRDVKSNGTNEKRIADTISVSRN